MRRALTEMSRGLSALVASAMRGVVTLTVQATDEQVGGSGFLVDPDGHLLTNHHVVQSFEPPVDVVLHGGARTTAAVVGVDPVSDLALLRLENPVRHHLHLRAEPARLGELCVALGSPLGEYRESVSFGVVSGVSRDMPQEHGRPICGMVQTDCAINQGNSGGPLLDMAGRVIGVNQSFDPRGSNIGLAVAAPTVSSVVAQLLATGRVRRATLGVTVRKTLAEVFGKPTHGLEVVSVDRPQKKGLRRGDVILRVAGSRVHEPAQIFAALGRRWIGNPMPVEIWRAGAKHALVLTPTELREEKPVPERQASSAKPRR
ncbi:MAG: pepA [Acidobacteria bacterium]|nr:pepA [Acidobacteriota bacterium]